jgi:3-dehydroquinate synthase
MMRLELPDLSSAPHATRLVLGAGAIDEVGDVAAPFASVLLVSDSNVAATPWPDRVADAIVQAGGSEPVRTILPPGDARKTVRAAEQAWREWLAAGAGRDAVVVGVGGGVVTDLAGFAASVYLRGVPWIAVPTTVLGIADAAIGGKTGVNLPEGKNLVGTFWHPRAVLADPLALSTLPGEIHREGWAEVVKAAAIADRGLFERLERGAERIQARDPGVTSELLESAVRVKVEVVRRDAVESGPREILNFGHALGHALEKASRHALSHGQAVAIGLVGEARLGVALGRLPADVPERLARCLSALGLPVSLPADLDDEALRSGLAVDKKRRSGRLRVAMPTALGAHDPAAPCVEAEAEDLLVAARG